VSAHFRLKTTETEKSTVKLPQTVSRFVGTHRLWDDDDDDDAMLY